MPYIRKIIARLLEGSVSEARRAAKELEDVGFLKMRGQDWTPFFAVIKHFENLPSPDRQVVFLSALRRMVIVAGSDEFERLSGFILRTLRHPSGKIRQAAVATGLELIYVLELAQFVMGKTEFTAVQERRVKRDRRRFMDFFVALENLRDGACDPRLEKFEYIEEMPPSVCKSAEMLIFELMSDPICERVIEAHKRGYLESLPLISSDSIFETDSVAGNGLEAPAWLDCTWRRFGCQKKECPVCSRVQKHRSEHMIHGDDPMAVELALADLRDSFKSAFGHIGRHLKKLGIKANMPKLQDPPTPPKFPLMEEVGAWVRGVYGVEEVARENGALWLGTEAAADLFWYANMLGAKVYGRLCGKWYMERGADYGEFDYRYSKKVIDEILGILHRSLHELSLLYATEKGELILAAGELRGLEAKIKNI